MLLQALHEFYERACRDGLIQDAAFTNKYIRWVIPLDADGNLEGGGLLEIPEIKKGGTPFSVPRSGRPKNAGGVGEFLWEGLEAMFALPADPDAVEPNERKREQQIANRQAKHDDFWRQITEAAKVTPSPALSAVLRFREKYLLDGPPGFLQWKANEGEKPAWFVTTASGAEQKLKADSFTFQVNGRLLLTDDNLRRHWQKCFAQENTDKAGASENGLCLVTGEEGVPISPSHLPKIARVPGAVATGATLISFDKDSFRSYGFEKSYNSPVSFRAVEAYCNALNFLVADKNHSFRIGDTALCFWAQHSDAVTDLFAALFEQPDPAAVRAFMRQPLTGDGGLAALDQENFYSVTLGGNAGRVVVRDWLQITVAQAVENFQQWFADLNLVPLKRHENDKLPPLALYRLALSTVREAKELRPETMTQLYRAALAGQKPALSLAHSLTNRLSVDLVKDGASALLNLPRFSLLRLIINRQRKEHEPMIEPTLTDTEDAAYNCGRLLAVFNELQAAAHDYKLEGAGVVERYYGTASSAPNSAFGILWRLHQHHLKKVARGNPAKSAALKAKIADIASRFRAVEMNNRPPEFPRSFDLRAQGRFALGFYQQIAADRRARQAYLDAQKPEGDTTDE
jgi:CRISPR-associated protein Csd1